MMSTSSSPSTTSKIMTRSILILFLGVLSCCNATFTAKDGCPPTAPNNGSFSQVYPVLSKHQATALLLLGFGGFSVMLAFLYVGIRKYVFNDANSLDTTFDAGGNVSTSLTAVTVASQLLWPGDLLQGATVTIKNGIAGAFWYTTCAVINMILFPVLSVQFKTRAPGAKTFLQVIYARFGTLAHLVFCFFALLMNLMVTTCLLTASVALLQALVKDANVEYCVVIMATLFGSYSFVGGLGSTFYVSYFNAAIIFVCLISFIVTVFYSGDDFGTFNSIDFLYEKVTCLVGPPKNEDRSYVTFWSEGAIIWAVQGFFATASITFCDQASWQSRIAAKPVQGVLGFLAATYMWFAIPSTIGTTMGLGYLAMAANNDTLPLAMDDIDSGLVVVFMAQRLMGTIGSYMALTMIIMAVMSSGSGEVMAISSIIVFDIYQTHLRPYKAVGNTNYCVLCGEPKCKQDDQRQTTPQENNDHHHNTNTTTTTTKYCECPDASGCGQCQNDLRKLRERAENNKQKVYHCPHHGDYRAYLDSLVVFKSWCILWVTISLIPIGMVILVSGVDLNYVTVCGFILTTPSFPPLLLTILWSKTTGPGIVLGSICGLAAGIIANLSVASTFDGGLGKFLMNTSHDYSVLSGSCAAFFTSIILTVLVSLLTNKIKSEGDEIAEWQKVRDIDNPLRPWNEIYEDDFPSLPKGQKPSYKELDQVFRKAKLTAYVGGSVSLLLFIIVIPGIMASMHVLEIDQFRVWISVLQIWCIIMAVIVVVVAPVEEILTICRQVRHNIRSKFDSTSKRSDTRSNATNSETEHLNLKQVDSNPTGV